MSPRNLKQNEQMRAESLKKITKSALRIISEYGYHGATLKKISKASGLSYGLVYHYFPSKDELFLHLIKEALDYSKSLMEKAFSLSGTAWEKIMAMSKLCSQEIQSEDIANYFVILQQAMTQVTDIDGIRSLMKSRMGHYQKFENLIKEAQKSGDVIDGDPEVLSVAYLSLLQGMTLVIQHQGAVKSKISPDIFINLLRKK